MNTEIDSRLALMKLIDSMDVPAIKQMHAFVAGYEAGKEERPPTRGVKKLGQPERRQKRRPG